MPTPTPTSTKAAGAAALGGIQPQTVPFDEHGALPIEEVAAVVKEDDPHFARTRLVCLENSQHGRVQSLDGMRAMRRFTRERGLALHLDGARMANAAVRLGVDLDALGREFDTVSLCLSKGLGAPAGSMLAGSRAFVDEARRWRKVTGGGMRQSGILAAAGILALGEGFERLHEDHENAACLAEALGDIDGVRVRAGWTQTNMVWLDFEDGEVGATLSAFARERGALMSAGRSHGRIVLHRDVSEEDATRVAAIVREHVESRAGAASEAGVRPSGPGRVPDPHRPPAPTAEPLS